MKQPARWLQAVMLVFSTYTRIPVPRVAWDDNASKLAIAFLPLAGAAIGLALWGWQALCHLCGLSPVLFAAGAVAVPIFISGGIHMDGYCDTVDALSSWQSRERRLEILRDPRIGAFAVIRCVVYLLLCFALLYELYIRGLDSGLGFLYPLARCLAAASTLTIPNARQDGMLVAFTARVKRSQVWGILGLLAVISTAGWVYFTFPGGLAGLALCLPLALWYRRLAVTNFGGATGDTTGYYLQTTELTLLAGLLLGGLLA